ncbi:MAG: SusC/RagA family TonB-linked outer membrane protein [Dysgonamonadaceae bacterium]|jgi:TonB-linked SusC/RagA family outer membrane protein|nr:SusC/RagA family TonB-linked outer membrane protein [Dysgonamonadaceae bacterium]
MQKHFKNRSEKHFGDDIFIFSIFFIFSLTWGSSVWAQQTDSVEEKVEKKVDIIYGSKTKQDMIESYSTVEGKVISDRPTYNMATTLYGVLPGLGFTINSGMLSEDPAYNFSLRGQTPLILVDGIPRTRINVPVEQIESVTVLKDALGLSMMGMTAGGGVVNITTKKGDPGRLKVSFSAQLAGNEQLNRPDYLNAYNYATLFNEASGNDGLHIPYSSADLGKYKDHSAIYTHPDVNWQDVLLKDKTQTQIYNLSFEGGGKNAKYFVHLGYYSQDGFLKENKSINTYKTSDFSKKYSLRTNLDMKLTPTTDFNLRMAGQMTKDNAPGGGITNLYNELTQTPNNAYPMLNPNGTLGGNLLYKTQNLYGQLLYAGYNNYNLADINIDMEVKQHFSGPLSGFFAKIAYSYNSMFRDAINRSKSSRGIYMYTEDADGKGQYTILSSPSVQSSSSDYNRLNRMMQYGIEVGYDYQKGNHTFNGLVSYNNNNFLFRNTLPVVNSGISGRFSYDYAKKYYAQLVTSYMGMNQFKKGSRFGFFPAVGLGWNISKEEWMSENSPINNLKLRTTFGMTGNNLTAPYFMMGAGNLSYYYDYLRFYSEDNAAYFGNTPSAQTALAMVSMGYKTTWEKNVRFNFGIDATAFNDKIDFIAEIFNNKINDMLVTRASNNAGILGINLNQENNGSATIRGFEAKLGYSDSHGDFSWTFGANVSLYKMTQDGYGEAHKEYEWMKRTGKNYGQYFGYHADGFFQNQSEIDSYLAKTKIESGYVPKPGDLRYKDLNNDGKINYMDIGNIGNKNPKALYGLYGQFSWKGLGFNMQWTGVANTEAMFTDDMPFQEYTRSNTAYTQATTNHLNRWTPENPNAKYPRLSVGKNSYNQANSTFWLRSTDYLRLKHVEIFYNLPKKWLAPLKLGGVKVFATGYNLLTVTHLKGRNPELTSYASVPDIKSVSAGINLHF